MGGGRAAQRPGADRTEGRAEGGTRAGNKEENNKNSKQARAKKGRQRLDSNSPLAACRGAASSLTTAAARASVAAASRPSARAARHSSSHLVLASCLAAVLSPCIATVPMVWAATVFCVVLFLFGSWVCACLCVRGGGERGGRRAGCEAGTSERAPRGCSGGGGSASLVFVSVSFRARGAFFFAGGTRARSTTSPRQDRTYRWLARRGELASVLSGEGGMGRGG